MIRAFLAIEMPETLRANLALVQAELKRSRADVRWVATGNIHLTLKFFGNVPDDEIDTLALAAREVASAEEPFQLKATIVGAPVPLIVTTARLARTVSMPISSILIINAFFNSQICL